MIDANRNLDENRKEKKQGCVTVALPEALSKLCNLTEEDQNVNTYNVVLSSIGNNHGGTYYYECIQERKQS
jgi:hypothetical protein